VQIWLRWTLPRIRIDQVLHACVKVLLPISLVTLLGTACWLALVPQPATPLGFDHALVRVAHLTGPTPWLQLVTQTILTVIGLALVGSFAAVVAWAWVHRDKQPRKSIFTDAMPVGREVAFTKPE
jgi:hypothetical protein